MKTTHKLVAAWALLGTLAADHALAQTSNFWIGTAGGNYTNPANWSLGAAPLTTQFVYFTNGANQTIQFTSSWTNKSLNVLNNSLTFDLNGYAWKSVATPFAGEPGAQLGTNGGAPMSLHFSASQAAAVPGGNVVTIGDSFYYADMIGNATTILVDDALGAPVKLSLGLGNGGQFPLGSRVVVSGPGSEFAITAGSGASWGGSVLVGNQALFNAGYIRPGVFGGLYSTTTVVNASLKSTGGEIGGYGGSLATVALSSNSVWTDTGTMYWGYSGQFQVNYSGRVFLNNSTYNGQTVIMGGTLNGNGPGLAQIVNASSVTLSNGLLITDLNLPGYTNTLVLDNSTINLGGGATAGYLTNRAVMRLGGTIQGQGSSRAVVRNEKILEVGNSPGTLTLTNANLELGPSSTIYFELGPHNPDGSPIVGGGTNDWVNIYGDLTLGGTLLVSALDGFGAFGSGNAGTNHYTLFTYTGTLVDNGLNIGSMPTGTRGWLNIDTTAKTVSLFVIPEPSAFSLLALGGLLGLRGRQRD